MKHKVFHFHALFYGWRRLISGEVISLGLALILVVSPVAALRFNQRSLYMQSSVPNAVTNYTVSFQYMSPDPVGSVDLLYCMSPVPTDPCVAPVGLDASRATLTSQSGETGYTIFSQSTNHIILSRVPVAPLGTGLSSYTFSGITNPNIDGQAFALRMMSLGSNDGTGPQIDFGSVRAEVANSIVLETQVPPILIFCVAQHVQRNCSGSDNTYYSNMGELSDTATLTTTSQMAVGTNAGSGFAITASGDLMSAGTNILPSPVAPTVSIQGVNQFGINLVENTLPAIGSNPDGDFINSLPTTNYGQPNKYMFASGDVVASAPSASLTRFTVSYIVNSSKDLRAGVYTTTINYIASGRF